VFEYKVTKESQSDLFKSEWFSQGYIEENIHPEFLRSKARALETHLRLEEEMRFPIPRSLLQTRWLSELGLCGVLRRCQLPPGFDLIKGYVELGCGLPRLDFDGDGMRHTFGLKEDLVLCLTFGQFYNPAKDIPAGRRIAYFQKKAPELIQVYPELEIAILLAPIREIKRRLGLTYKMSEDE
jgi:hypothetical protein